MQNYADHHLGTTDDTLALETVAENRRAIVAMARQSRNTIDIISRDLDPPIYDATEFVDAVQEMVLQNRRARIRILVFEAQAIRRKGHRFLNLGDRLSTYINFRIPPPEFHTFNESVFVADAAGYVHRLNSERFEATANFCDRLQSKYLLNQIDEMWDKAGPDPNLRQINI